MCFRKVGAVGFEPTTFCVSDRYSNQLSYTPVYIKNEEQNIFQCATPYKTSIVVFNPILIVSVNDCVISKFNTIIIIIIELSFYLLLTSAIFCHQGNKAELRGATSNFLSQLPKQLNLAQDCLPTNFTHHSASILNFYLT